MAAGGILGGYFVAVGSLVSSMDALLPRVCGLTSWKILGRRGRLVFIGGCFTAVATGCSCAFSGWMICHHGFVYLGGNLCVDSFIAGSVIGLRCRGQCRGVGTATSIVVRVGVRVRVFGGSGGLKNTRIIEDATVYPGSGRSVPYIQQLMILILKSTQNQGFTTV